jgi:hypothetical protein
MLRFDFDFDDTLSLDSGAIRRFRCYPSLPVPFSLIPTLAFPACLMCNFKTSIRASGYDY